MAYYDNNMYYGDGQLVSIVSVSSNATAGMSSSAVTVTRVLVTDCVDRSTSVDVERSTSVVIICSDYKMKVCKSRNTNKLFET